MTLYSKNGGIPAPLPVRIRVPVANGWRWITHPSTWTEAQITAAGYQVAPEKPAPVGGIEAQWYGGQYHSAPAFDPATHHAPVWGGTAWAAPVAKSAADLAAELAARKASMKADITVERDRRVYLPIAAVDIKGDGSVMVEPDIRNERDRANLGDLHTRALALVVAGVTTAVIKFGAADNVQYTVTPAEMLAIVTAPFDRASGLYVRARELRAAVDDAANDAALDLIDIAAGSIGGTGAWPT